MEKNLSEYHPNIATSYWNLADLHKKQLKNTEAKQFYEKALYIFQQVFDEQHPHLQMCKEQYEDFLKMFKQDATD